MNSEESRWFPLKALGPFPESSGDLTRKAGAQGSLGGGGHQGVLRVCLTVGWREKVNPRPGPQSFSHILFTAKVGGRVMGGALIQGLGEQRLNRQALRSPTQGGLTP